MNDFVDRLLGTPTPRLRPLAPNMFDPGAPRLPGGESPAYEPVVQEEVLAPLPGVGAEEFPYDPSPIEGKGVRPVSTPPGPTHLAEHNTDLGVPPNPVEYDVVAGASAPVLACPAESHSERTASIASPGPESEAALRADPWDIDHRAQDDGVPPVEVRTHTSRGVRASGESAVSTPMLAQEPQPSGASAVVGNRTAPVDPAPSVENRTRTGAGHPTDSPSFPLHRPQAAGEPALYRNRTPDATEPPENPPRSERPQPSHSEPEAPCARPVPTHHMPASPPPYLRAGAFANGSGVSPQDLVVPPEAQGTTSLQEPGVQPDDVGGSTKAPTAPASSTTPTHGEAAPAEPPARPATPAALPVTIAPPPPAGPKSSPAPSEASPPQPESVPIPDTPQTNSPSNPLLALALHVRTAGPATSRPTPTRPTAPPAPKVSTATKTPRETVVCVTIDRLVVHTAPSPSVVDAPAPQRRSRLNLEEYLGRRCE